VALARSTCSTASKPPGANMLFTGEHGKVVVQVAEERPTSTA
jgi:hypothetical protein